MPHPQYHFGTSAFFALLFRRWLDVPVFVLANVIVDLEVLGHDFFQADSCPHQFLHFHSLLIGAAIGIVWGLTAYFIKPIRWLFEYSMKILRMPYKSSLIKAGISGILGVWLHVFIDNIYHYDVQMLWPSRAKPIWRFLARRRIRATQEQIELICTVFIVAAVIVYVITVIRSIRKDRAAKS